MNAIIAITLVIFVSSCTATYNGHNLIIKHDAPYAYPNSVSVPPHSPYGTSVRYDVRYNSQKFGYSAPVAPLPVYSIPQGYPSSHPVAAYAHPVGIPIAYVRPYSSAHTHNFIGRHFEPEYHH